MPVSSPSLIDDDDPPQRPGRSAFLEAMMDQWVRRAIWAVRIAVYGLAIVVAGFAMIAAVLSWFLGPETLHQPGEAAKSFDLAAWLDSTIRFLAFLTASGYPLIGPIVLSRRGVLSIARWGILAGLCFVLWSVACLGHSGVEAHARATGKETNPTFLYLAIPLFFGFIGCAIAAVVAPTPKSNRP